MGRRDLIEEAGILRLTDRHLSQVWQIRYQKITGTTLVEGIQIAANIVQGLLGIRNPPINVVIGPRPVHKKGIVRRGGIGGQKRLLQFNLSRDSRQTWTTGRE